MDARLGQKLCRALDDFFHVFLHDVLLVRRGRNHGVGSRFHCFNEQSIQDKRLSVQSGEGDHGHPRLTFQVDEFLQHFVRRGDDAGVGLKRPLGYDHFRELCRQVDVGHL